jgi:hypothetical protein
MRIEKRVGRKQKAEGSKSVSLVRCLLLSAYCLLFFSNPQSEIRILQ